jgi:carbamoyltransferase
MIVFGIYGAFDWDANKSLDSRGQPAWVHDSGATLFVNGKHICSISEERLTRTKYEGNYPKHSIDYCLSVGNIDPEDVDCIYIPSMFLKLFIDSFQNNYIHQFISKKFPNAEIKVISHHLCHAASTVFSSNFNEGSFLTIDGAGSVLLTHNNELTGVENNTIGYFNKEKNIFRLYNIHNNMNCFSRYYSFLCFKIYGKKMGMQIEMDDEKYREGMEGKVMGLSGYGRATYKFKNSDIHYKMSGDMYDVGYPYVRFVERHPSSFFERPAEEQAYITQENFERAILSYATELKEQGYLDDYLCLAGGSFLNVLGNSILKQSGLFKDIHIPPCTNDTGLHFGAACLGQFRNNQPIELPHNIALLGKEYSDDEIKSALDEPKLQYDRYEDFEELCEFTAKQLNDQKIIGWFQGRSEFGPRALGSRSLLMHPGPAENKDIMNERVKHREYWRPFAGIILEENLTDYFNEDFNSPYMLYSLTVKEEKKKELGAITHVDGTCRIQTVNNKINERVTTLLNKFNEVSGIPVVLNTSFNDNGEPIVESPQDAVRSFLNMDIDYLVIGNYVVRK